MANVCYKCKQQINGIEHEGLHEKCFCDWFKVSRPTHFENIRKIRQDQEPNEWEIIASSFFQGVFPKYSAVLDQKKYIIKIGEKNTKELPATEFLCNEIARFLGILVPDFYLIRFSNTRDAFVCYNFMQDYSRANLVHIYQFLEKPENFNCRYLIQVLLKLKVINAEDRFVRLCLFDALIGNHDRHGRNLGIIETSSNFDLSPIYDNPSYLATEDFLEAHHHPTGAIAVSESQEPSMADYVVEFCRLGYAELVNKFYRQVKRDYLQISDLINHSFISESRKNSFKRLIDKRFGELHTSLNQYTYQSSRK